MHTSTCPSSAQLRQPAVASMACRSEPTQFQTHLTTDHVRLWRLLEPGLITQVQVLHPLHLFTSCNHVTDLLTQVLCCSTRPLETCMLCWDAFQPCRKPADPAL
jgi:hypothetical protein